MRNLGTIILLIWWIWAGYNSGRIVRVSVPTRIGASVWCRVFLLGIFFSDRSRCHRWVTNSRVNDVSPPLRVRTRTQHKHPSYNC